MSIQAMVRGAERTRLVTASTPTRATIAQRTDRQSRSTVRTVSVRGSGTPVLYRSMSAMPVEEPSPANERLRLSPRSVVAAVAIFGATLALLSALDASKRVLGWLVVAAIVAALLHPVVGMLEGRLPRGLAIVVAVVGVLGSLGVVGYGVVQDVSDQVDRLERAAPQAAREIARSERFGDLAEEIDLVDRVERFVSEVPDRLRGGDPAEALRSAATRGVAFLATGVLMLFLLLHGPRMLAAGLGQLPPARQDRVREVASGAYVRACRYVRRSILKSVLAGLLAWGLAQWAGLPGPAPLGVWMAMWALVPLLGVVVGGVPLVVLAAGFESGEWVTALALAVVVWQLVDAFALQRWVESSAVRIGPFLVLAGGFLGLELYGLGGMLVGIVGMVAGVAVADELAPGDEEAVRGPAPGDEEGVEPAPAG